MDWQTLLIVGLILGVTAVYGIWQREFRAPGLGLQHRLDDFAKAAIKQAKNDFKLKLDYSVESFADVDRILDELHEQHAHTPIPENTLSKLVLVWGGYVGISLQRIHGGVWHTNSATAGENTYPLIIDGFEAIPVVWSLRRLRKKDANSIVNQYREFADRLSSRA